jgi:glucose-1-phosphate cytidylyltransferase
MVCEPEIFDYLGDGSEMLEAGPFEKLAAEKQMAAYPHPGFWSPMDTIHDRDYLEKLWQSGEAPWAAGWK